MRNRRASQAPLSCGQRGLLEGVAKDSEPARFPHLFSSGAAASAGLLADLPESPAQNAAGVAAKERGRLLYGRGRSLTHQLAALLGVFVCANAVVVERIIAPLINFVSVSHILPFFFFTNPRFQLVLVAKMENGSYKNRWDLFLLLLLR